MARFNYMLPKVEQIRKCKEGGEHYYMPVSVRATVNNIGVRFFCKKCNEIAVGFFTPEEYEARKKTIEREIERLNRTQI